MDSLRSCFAASFSRSFAIAALVVLSAPTFATVQRTFVASNGLDTNSCSLAAPCRSFARAITQTNAGGEVIVVDSAGYGPVAITQSVTITAPGGVYAGISVFAGDGITVSGSNVVVVLRGLSINGQGGSNGITIVGDAATVHVESCVVSNMINAGIRQVSGTLEVKDTIVRSGAYGVYVQGPGQATLDRVRLEGNATGLAAEFAGRVAMQDSVVTRSSNIGVIAGYGTSQTERSSVTITRSLISFNQFGIYLDPGLGYPDIAVSDCTISDSSSWGIFANGSSKLYVTRTTIVRSVSGGIRLLPDAIAVLEGNYVNNLSAHLDISADAGSLIYTFGNNRWVYHNINGTVAALPGG